MASPKKTSTSVRLAPGCSKKIFGSGQAANPAMLTTSTRLASGQKRFCKQQTTRLCGQAHEYPQDRMCETTRLGHRRFFVQLTSLPDASLVQQFEKHVNP